jgi:thioredoxin reductase
MDHQVVIVGGGPAAHNAALALGRARKRVLLCDEGKPRNRVSAHSHTFFTRDGTPPAELRRIALEQLRTYDTVTVREDRVTGVQPEGDGFRVSLADGNAVTARFVLLAVGMVDRFPDVTGFEPLWGDTVIHCPYCHGWEVRDLPWAVYVDAELPLPRLINLRSWSDDVLVIVRSGFSLPDEARQELEARGLRVETGTLRALHAENGKLASVELEDGRRIPRRALLYAPQQEQTPLVQGLGLELDEMGYVVTDELGQTSVPGLFAAGDLTTPRQQIGLAAASGLITAVNIDHALAMGRP